MCSHQRGLWSTVPLQPSPTLQPGIMSGAPTHNNVDEARKCMPRCWCGGVPDQLLFISRIQFQHLRTSLQISVPAPQPAGFALHWEAAQRVNTKVSPSTMALDHSLIRTCPHHCLHCEHFWYPLS